MKNPNEDRRGEAHDQIELVVVPGDSKDILQKALRQQLSLYGSKVFSGEALKAHVLAETKGISFTEGQRQAIEEDHKKRVCNVLIGRLKALGTRAIDAHVNGLGFQGATEPTRELVRYAVITVGKDEHKRLLYINKPEIRDAVEYLKAVKALSDHRAEKTIRAYEAFLQKMGDERSELAGDLFPDV